MMKVYSIQITLCHVFGVLTVKRLCACYYTDYNDTVLLDSRKLLRSGNGTSNNSGIVSEADEVLSQAFERIDGLEKLIKRLQRSNDDLHGRLSRRKRHIKEKYQYQKQLAEQERDRSRSRSRNHNHKKRKSDVDEDEEDDDLDAYY